MISIDEHLEDFDNQDLPHYERLAELREAVEEYNDMHGTSYKPEPTVRNYLNWLRRGKDELQDDEYFT